MANPIRYLTLVVAEIAVFHVDIHPALAPIGPRLLAPVSVASTWDVVVAFAGYRVSDIRGDEKR